jgi:hypothetical protein
LRCVDDYLAGRRYPLDCLTHLGNDGIVNLSAARG